MNNVMCKQLLTLHVKLALINEKVSFWIWSSHEKDKLLHQKILLLSLIIYT